MAKHIKKSGQKITQKITRLSRKTAIEGREHVKENLVGRISHIKNVKLLIVEWILLVTAIMLLAVTQLLWYSDSYSVQTYTYGGTYTEATLGEVKSLNPLFANTNSEKALSKLLFATLTKTDYSGHTGSGLAEKISVNENGDVWTIKLRDNLKWSDGEPLTNEDVLFTVGIIKNSAVTTNYDSNLSGVSVREEEGKIIFELPASYANFSSALNIPILPKHVLADVDPKLLLENQFSTNPVSSGPFSFNATQASTTNTGESVVYLVPNQYYYNGKPLLSSFAVHTYATKEDIIDAVKSGSVTATSELQASAAEEIKSSNIYERQASLSNGIYLFFNTNSAVFKNKNLRKAVQKGINTEDLRALIGDNIPLNYPITPNQIELENYPEIPAYNIEEAKKIVAETEFDREATINLASISTGYFADVTQNLAEQLTELGFKVEVQLYESNQEFITNVISTRTYDILLYEIELGPDPDLLAYYHSSQNSSVGLNLSNYKNPLMDDLILAARSTMDVDLRKAKYEAVLKQWVEDVPSIGIAQTNMSYFYNKNVSIFSEDNRLVYPTDRFNDVEYWGAQKTRKNRTP